MTDIDSDLAAKREELKKLEEMKRQQQIGQTRERAEAKWRASKLPDFGDRICEHYEMCANVRRYIPQTGTPKATLSLLPLPAHPQRTKPGEPDTSCPGCDVHRWAMCLREAGANPILPADPGAGKLLEMIEVEVSAT
jgi:hypothetical protein